MINWKHDSAGNADLCWIVTGRSHLPNYIYILAHPSGDAIVVDPGYAAETIKTELARHKLSLCGVLLTHGHSDHLAVVTDLNPPRTILMSGEKIDKGYDLPNLTRCTHDHPFDLGAFRIHPFATPGHSQGSACYLIGLRLFTGDTVFMESIGDCTGPDGDINQMFGSIVMLKERIADDVLVYPGHCFHTTPGHSFGWVRQMNIYFRLNEKEAFANWHHRFAGSVFRNEVNYAKS